MGGVYLVRLVGDLAARGGVLNEGSRGGDGGVWWFGGFWFMGGGFLWQVVFDLDFFWFGFLVLGGARVFGGLVWFFGFFWWIGFLGLVLVGFGFGGV